jgi:hypothetical protein
MKWLGVVVACLLAAGGGYLLFRDDPQREVDVRAGDPMPASLNRADDYGADTLRAYLTAALSCNAAGERAKARLGRADAALEKALAGACEPSRAEALTGETAREELDPRGRSLWRLSADGGSLPSGLHVWLAQAGGSGWMVDTACHPLSAC